MPGLGQDLDPGQRALRACCCAGADPAAILCVTYTKAAAAEMQNRLFERLGQWAVATDRALRTALDDLAEPVGDLARARRLFAGALETPGGLKIQTIHAFCETLLKRFPLEAGVSPTFQVLEDAEAQIVAAHARDRLAAVAQDSPQADIGRAYGHFSIGARLAPLQRDVLRLRRRRRAAIAAYAGEDPDWLWPDVWFRCGFDQPDDRRKTIEVAAVAGDRLGRQARRGRGAGRQPRYERRQAARPHHGRAWTNSTLSPPVWASFCDRRLPSPARSRSPPTQVDPAYPHLAGQAEQARLGRGAWPGARRRCVARDTEYAITLAA